VHLTLPDAISTEACRLPSGAVGLDSVQLDTTVSAIIAIITPQRYSGFVPPPHIMPPGEPSEAINDPALTHLLSDGTASGTKPNKRTPRIHLLPSLPIQPRTTHLPAHPS
jgi:hypothetical protein